MTTTPANAQKTILLLFGGESPEHEVSLASARNVSHAIGKEHTVIFCYISRDGQWWHVDKVADDTSGQVITPLLGKSAIKVGPQEVKIDVIFPVLHGQNGEDGTVQSLGRLMHTPIVGCGINGSVLCMDKTLTKRLLQDANILVVPYVVCENHMPRPTYAVLAAQLDSSALFVKPARLGSSIGISKASSAEELAAALDTAFKYDSKVLIEAGLPVREIEVAVLGHNATPQASVAGEIIPDRDFYSYDSKYDNNSTSAIKIPAELDAKMADRIRALAVQTFQTLDCQGLARVDFFINTSTSELYVNEVNTLPGFTNISMYPKLWEASGISYADLVEKLITLAA